MIYPINFSIPKEKIINFIPNKKKILSNIIPGGPKNYTFTNEIDYYKEYQESYFGLTKKKGGWDCLRHYEIMANGCIPIFENIERCPENTLKLLPKNLLIKGNILYNNISKKKINELTDEEINECNNLILDLLNYTKKNLTTESIAKYILEKIKNINEKKILYLSGSTRTDYLRCLTLHGFKTLFKNNCYDYPKISHIYKDSTIEYNKLYGRGMTYSNLLNQELHTELNDDIITKNIKENYYDIIIYGSCHRGLPFYDLIVKYYKSNNIILLCGEDTHKKIHRKRICNFIKLKHNIFIRELI